MFFLFAVAKAQVPANDNCSGAITLANLSGFCSAAAAYSNVNATAGGLVKSQAWPSAGNDVWFKFTATAFDVNISVTGNENGNGTLVLPLVALYTTTDCLSFSEMIGSNSNGATVSTIYKGGLTIGQTYYIRVSADANSTGTFKLCINNYNPVLKAGQDYSTASIICTKDVFTQTNVTGAGSNNRESAGTCLDVNSGNGPIEANTAWYKWTAANNGTLTFTISPTVSGDDIDWVLYDLGTSGSPSNVNAANSIRCASGSGVNCTPFYNQTGLNLTSTDLTENPGCITGQDGFVKYIDMIQGHVYALLINNFSSGNNGFTISFAGSGTTGTFLGPTAALDQQVNNGCTQNPSFTFTNKSTNYTSISWLFGDGANQATATGDGPYTITYNTPGTKTVVIQATSAQGCVSVAYKTFVVPLKPTTPLLLSAKNSYCLGDNLILRSNATTSGTTYNWQGPNGFTSTDSVVTIPITNYNQSGIYKLVINQNGCTSDAASITIPAIGKTPVLDFTITTNNMCSTQQSFTITNNSTDYTTLNWDFGKDASIIPATGNGPFTVTYTSYGDKTITLNATGDQGCTAVLSKTATFPQKPIIVYPLNKLSGPYCIGDTIIMSTPAQANTIYNWTGPNNFTSDQAQIRVPITGTSVAGTYTLVITQGLCSSDPVSTTINTSDITAIPVAAFDASPIIPGTGAVPLTVSFTNLSTNADSYLWDFGDGTTSTLKNPQHLYTTKGSFTVKLTATNKGACSNTVSLGKLVLRYNVTIFIPNTFTPNNDAINDDFGVKITNLKDYRIRIFNRYGMQLYEAKDILKRWDGFYNGQPVPVGTYYYVITATTLNDDALKEAGYVTVLR